MGVGVPRWCFFFFAGRPCAPFRTVVGPGVRDGAPRRRQFEWVKEGEERTQLSAEELLIHQRLPDPVGSMLSRLLQVALRFIERSPALFPPLLVIDLF